MIKIPLYDYECIYCFTQFEEFHKINESSGKSWCPKCGATAFKIPSVVHSKVFRPREFADGTTTPPEVDTFEKEKVWKKKESIHYDPASKGQKKRATKERQQKGATTMELAFKKANEKSKIVRGKEA